MILLPTQPKLTVLKKGVRVSIQNKIYVGLCRFEVECWYFSSRTSRLGM